MQISFEINKKGDSDILKITLLEGQRSTSSVVENYDTPYQNILFNLLDNTRLTVGERELAEDTLERFIGYLMWDGHKSDEKEKQSEEMIVEKKR